MFFIQIDFQFLTLLVGQGRIDDPFKTYRLVIFRGNLTGKLQGIVHAGLHRLPSKIHLVFEVNIRGKDRKNPPTKVGAVKRIFFEFERFQIFFIRISHPSYELWTAFGFLIDII